MPEPTTSTLIPGAAAAPAKETNQDGPSPSGPSNAARTLWPTAVIGAMIVGIYYVGSNRSFSGRQSWIWILLLLAALFLYLGSIISKRPLGILVGPRNLMSLSRFQIVAWSLVVLSALLTIAFRRVAGGVPAPLDMALDPNLWALMGISTASLVGTPLILQGKATQEAHPDHVKNCAAVLGEKPEDVDNNRQGKLYANSSIKDARISDMFEGDEIGNTAYVDISKVQMFMFTMIMIVAYCSEVYAVLGQHGEADKLAMPRLSQGMIALLGISHAGYLTSKTADHTPTPATS
jgi:hypothetical protein